MIDTARFYAHTEALIADDSKTDSNDLNVGTVGFNGNKILSWPFSQRMIFFSSFRLFCIL